MDKKIILVTGTPGVGKSSVSKVLSKRLGAVYINLTEFVKNNNLTISYDGHRKTFIVDEERTSSCLERFIKNLDTQHVIVNSHYAMFVVPPSLIYRVFVLRRHPAELKSILLERGYDEKKLYENLASEILDVCLIDAIERCGVSRICEVNVSGKEVDQVVEEILECLSGSRKCEVGVVDWLGDLEKENKLDEFLKF